MYDARVARVAALYRSGSSTDSLPIPRDLAPVQTPDKKARLWQAELAKSMATVERNRSRLTTTALPASSTSLRPVPGLVIVAPR